MTGTVLAVLHVVVLTVGERDPGVLAGVRALGANAVVTFARPSAEASAAAAAAGLTYVPFLSVRDVDALLTDPDAVHALRQIPGIAGFHYYDEDVVEGHTPADEQERTYAILKALFPEALVFYAMRLDLVSLEPGYLDAYFGSGAADFVAPYFYPVGTTTLGLFEEEDAWRGQLAALLAPLAARMGEGQKVLPVLQAFEQRGFPVGARFPARQLEVYREFWPDLEDVAAFWWGDPADATLIGLFDEPALRAGVTRLFRDLPPPVPATRVVGPR